MNLNDIVPAPNAAKVNQLAKRVFGYALDLDNLSETKAKRLHKNLSSQMNIYESKLGSASQTRTKYYEMKIALEALTKHIQEKEGAKPDFLDLDKDGDTKEPMKKAAKDKGDAPKKKKDLSKVPPQLRKSMEESVVTEGVVEGSELVMAAKSMVDKYDAMIQDVGEMLNEELTPLVDKVRDEMGSDVAEQYLATMTNALNATMAGMKQDRMVADDASRILTGEAPAAPMGAPDPMADEIPADEMAMEPMDDEFAAADAAQGGEEQPVGREKRN